MNVDLRPVVPKKRPATVLQLFKKLERGCGVTFISDRSELDILEFLQRKRAGEFDWSQLETEPGRWLLMLSRRPAGMPRRRQVLEFMEADHQRVYEMLDVLRESACRGEADAVIDAARHLQTCLERHFRIEEQVLLPVIMERLGEEQLPVTVRQEEHVQIAQRLQRILDGGEPMPFVVELCEMLASRLQHHAGMEERLFYAVTDVLLSEQERDELVRRCQKL